MIRILVIDDDSLIRSLLMMLLSREGYEVVTAENGRDAINKLDRGLQPDLVLLDLVMPEISGAEFLNICENKKYNHPVVVLTAYMEELKTVARKNIKRVLEKPVIIGNLLGAIREAIQES